MIVFLQSDAHTYTLKKVLGDHLGVSVRSMAYGQIGTLRALPRATYVFTDLDRLPTEMLRAAGALYQQIRQQGGRALNDPARVLSRYGLLRNLFKRGINRFNAYRAEDGEAPTRWPVFLRTEGDHLSPFGELYQGLDELQRGIAGAIDRGIPVCRLLIVEFAAEPVRPGLYRKLASFRVGKATFAEVCVHDTQWIAKAGQKGIATDELYDDELRIVRDNPHGPDLAAAFDIAGIEYGRADFGLVGGNVQVYEINSNPTIGLGGDHPNASRMKSYQQFRENYTAALRAIDTPT